MELITNDMILLDVSVADKNEVIKTIADLLEKNQRLVDKNQYIHDVWEREDIVPTSIGDLIAIPHALSAGVITSSLVYLRLSKEIKWNDEDEAKYIFGIAVPNSNNEQEHLRILSSVARKMLDDHFREKILFSDSKDTILSVLNGDDSL